MLIPVTKEKYVDLFHVQTAWWLTLPSILSAVAEISAVQSVLQESVLSSQALTVVNNNTNQRVNVTQLARQYL